MAVAASAATTKKQIQQNWMWTDLNGIFKLRYWNWNFKLTWARRPVDVLHFELWHCKWTNIFRLSVMQSISGNECTLINKRKIGFLILIQSHSLLVFVSLALSLFVIRSFVHSHVLPSLITFFFSCVWSLSFFFFCSVSFPNRYVTKTKSTSFKTILIAQTFHIYPKFIHIHMLIAKFTAFSIHSNCQTQFGLPHCIGTRKKEHFVSGYFEEKKKKNKQDFVLLVFIVADSSELKNITLCRRKLLSIPRRSHTELSSNFSIRQK